jgi:transposase
MTHTHARSPIGERAEVSEPFNRGNNISVIGSMSLSGVGPTLTIKCPVDTQVFDAYVEYFLVPTLLPGDKVLLDNVKFHYSQRALDLIYAAGAKVIHIPAYSPDYNPIEECLSKIKEALRQAKARTVRKLFKALARAIEKVTIDISAAGSRIAATPSHSTEIRCKPRRENFRYEC